MKESKSNSELEAGKNTASTEKQTEGKPIRADLAEVIERHARGLDENRPEAVASRQKKNQRMVRVNINDLCDGDFTEYGALAVAAQRQRRTMDDLTRRTPADGVVAGIGSVNASLFNEDKARCMVIAYDYTVLAGTQGYYGHKKKDRMIKIAHEQRLPVFLFAEGGGGRPADVDAEPVWPAGLDVSTFAQFAKLNGKVPIVGIVSGRCFAGNAVLLGCCDVIIAAQNTNIGTGGPVMVEGGGLGTFKPEDIGPMEVQTKNGVVDIAVADDVEAVAVAKKYISYFQGPVDKWEAADQRILRDIVPEQRRRVYDIRTVIKTIADKDTFLELKADFGLGMITGFIRIGGNPFGIIANNCKYMAGAIEAEGADKAARLIQICNSYGLPVISLGDTPGFMVGPEIEKRAQIRHVCRMFMAASHFNPPFFTVFLRRGYGLGSQAMAKGGFHEPFFTIAWPTGEFGGMGLEGYVKKGFKKELDAVADPQEREALYQKLVSGLYDRGKAINIGSHLEVDAVIDPADTRKWILQGLKSASKQTGERLGHDFIDTW
ncbi:MAG: carboxyl transferase domain-containing protein [Dehalococcoidales bacterium]|nr:carboxyl transferase domain-containing protein [Dehalococcoidales bacterium]